MSDRAGSVERLFGTDGIRGTPGTYPLTDGMLLKIGCSIAKIIKYKQPHKEKFCVIIGKDTRLSGSKIETFLSDAITSSGVHVLLAGIMTTPGLSFLVRDLGADMGIMISASHNKASDNGIKFFDAQGYKLLPEEEAWIEKIIFEELIHSAPSSSADDCKTMSEIPDAASRYKHFLQSTMEGYSLSGMHLAIDCAWGATSLFARDVFEGLGATVHAIHDKPQGENINEGGTMAPEFLRKLILDDHAQFGVAFDGDGDRGMIIDEQGRILDGDFLMAIIARHRLSQSDLPRKSIVATVMSNYGLKESIEAAGGKIITTSVGDKHVLEALIEHTLALGGEQSGHIVFFDYLPTPDGMLTALQVLKVMRQTGKSLSELAQCMRKFPQTLINIRVREKKPFDQIPSVVEALDGFNRQLKDMGRILLRYSGTESLARVMVEGKDERMIREIAQSLADRIRNEIGCA